MRFPSRPQRRAALLFALLLLLAAASPIRAASPSSGTVGPSALSLTWQGPNYVLASVPDPAACAPPDPANLCDHFALTVSVDPTYWATNTGGVLVEITCPIKTNDFDLYIFDANGTRVGSSAGPTCDERVFLQNPSGTYEVRVVPFLVMNSNYTGTATFVSTPGGPTPNPPRDSGGITFGPATVVDAQRTEGEPVNFIDRLGNYWESGPFGTSTQLSFIHRSTDGGDQFNVVSPSGLRGDPPPGGGDTDITVDDQGNAYFVDLEALANIGAAVSNDNGNTWRKNPAAVQNVVVDRQWLAVDNLDRRVFMAVRQIPLGSFIYSTPASTGPADPVGGLVYTSTSVSAVSTGAPCGQLRFDPVNRNLYYPCAKSSPKPHVEITVGKVNPANPGTVTYRNVQAPDSPGGGSVATIFPMVAVDRGGNLYAVWIDHNNHNVYYSASTDEGTTWGPVRQVNGNDANSNVWPWPQGGNAGTLAIAWYGNDSRVDSNLMPSWYTDRRAATAFKWFGYAALVTDATGATPSFAQQKFTAKPMHYGQICTGGLGCSTSSGDRTMADFFSVFLDLDGSMRIVFNDTTSQHHGAHLFEARQLTGLGAFGTPITKPAPTNPMPDPTGDARFPHYAPTGAGNNLPNLDFTELRLSQPDADTLRVQMTVGDLSSLAPPPGKAGALWLTRFQALSRGDRGEEAYRIFYVGAESVASAPPTFFAGSGNSAQGSFAGNGCVITTAENCKFVQYPPEFSAAGSIVGNTITIDVALTGFGPGRPILGDTLFNVTALSGGRNNSTTDIYADVDATRAFDFVLGSAPPPPPPPCGDDHKAEGEGEIDGGSTGNSDFAFECDGEFQKFNVQGSTVSFRSAAVRSASYDPVAHSATFTGIGVNQNHLVTFTVVAVDSVASTGFFSITLSDGFSAGGNLLRGRIRVT